MAAGQGLRWRGMGCWRDPVQVRMTGLGHTSGSGEEMS